ncbi:unnamed protein product [Lupinus luteus]|uniref:Uncharacterized protein n=1 Tax=Lupinus luteus TaxID=3873 RepID=A0AAV1WZH6_LUPLU
MNILIESISELSSQDNGFIAIENVKSAEILDKESLFSELNKDVGLPSHVEDDPELMTAPEKQSSIVQVAEPILNNDAPSVSWNWKEEDIDAPRTSSGPHILNELLFLSTKIWICICKFFIEFELWQCFLVYITFSSLNMGEHYNDMSLFSNMQFQKVIHVLQSQCFRYYLIRKLIYLFCFVIVSFHALIWFILIFIVYEIFLVF